MALHEQALGATNEWYTPEYVFDAMGVTFDLDVAHPGRHVVDWIPVRHVLVQDGLNQEWGGLVWMNAPFGGRNGLRPWLTKFFQHANGVALVPDRTSAPWFGEFAYSADLVLFVREKIRFIGADLLPGKSPAQGTALLASGARGIEALARASRMGLGGLMCPVRP